MSVDIIAISIEARSVGIDTATKSLNSLADAADKVEKSVEKVSSSSSNNSDAASKAASAIDKLLVKYQAQVDLLGATTAASNAYNAALKGGSDAQQSAAAFLGAEVDAYKALTQAQSEGIAANKALDASYNSLAKQADAYYASQQKIAQAAQALNDAGYRAQEYAKLKDAMKALEDETNALAAAEARQKAAQQNRDIEIHTAQVRAYSAAQAEAIKINNDLIASEQRDASEKKAQAAATRLAAEQAVMAGNQFVQSLKDQAARTTLTGQALRDYNSELLRTKAAQLGVSSQAEGYIKTMQEAEKASGHAAGGTSGITRELLVLGHEMSQGQFNRFAGSMMVLAERIDLSAGAAAGFSKVFQGLMPIVSAIFSPISLVVIAVAALAVAFVKGGSEQRAFNNALVLTGNYAGTTTSSMEALARSTVAASGSIGEAKKVILELAESGRFTATQIGFISDAIISVEHATGKSGASIIKDFEQIAEMATTSTGRSTDVISRHVLSLNDHYHFLTAAQFEQISALEKTGQAQEAANLSEELYAKALKSRADEIKDNLGTIQSAWHGITEAAGKAWDAMLGIGKKVDARDNIERIKGMLTTMDSRPGFISGNGQGGNFQKSFDESRLRIVQELTAEVIKLNAEDAKANQIGKDQQAQAAGAHAIARTRAVELQVSKETKLAQMLKEQATNDDIAKKAIAIDLASGDAAKIAAAEQANLMFTKEAIAQRNEDIIAKFSEKEKKVRAEGTSGIDEELKQIQAAAEWERRSLESQVSVLDNAYKKKMMSVSDYTEQKDKLLKQEQTNTTETYTKEIEALLLWANAASRTTSERNVAGQKIQEFSKQTIDALAKQDTAIEINGNLFSQVMQKEIDDNQKASDRIVDSIERKTEGIQAQVRAYNNLPDAVKQAGITEKQMQDAVSQARIDALDEAIEAEMKEQIVNERTIEQYREQRDALVGLRDVQKENEEQQKTNKFNLGFGARAKEESAMAVQAFNDAGKTISEGFTSIFGDAGKPMADFFKAFTDGLAKQTAATERYNKVKEAYKDAPEAIKLQKLKEADVKLTQEQTQANLGMYADVAAGAQGFFDKQSTGYKLMGAVSTAFHAAEVAMAIASIAPKIAAGAASMFATLGPFGFAAVAGMVAVMAGFGFAGGGGSSAPPTSAVRQAANGTGSVLGAGDVKSESIQKALDTIAKDSGLGLVHFNSMDKSLQQLVTGISGLSSLLVRGTNLTSKPPADTIGTAQSAFNSILGNQSIGEKLSGGLLGKLVGGIFGGAKSVEDVGLKVSTGSVGSIASNGLNVSQYTDTKTKGGIFSSDKYNTDIKNLGTEVNTQFSMIVNSLADTIKSAATSLGVGGKAFEDHLSQFVVDIGEISTKGLTGAQIQEALQAAFSKLGDDMAKFAIVGLDQFQKVGEGYLETVARVANDLIQVKDVFAVLGKTLNLTGLDAVKASESLIGMFGSIDKLTSATQYYVDNFKTDAEKLVPIQKSLNDELHRLGIASDISTNQFKALVDQQDLTTSAGQQMFAALMNIAPAFKAVTDSTEAAAKAMTDLLSKRLDMQLTIADLENNTAASAAIIAQQRVIELAAMDASLRPLQERINLLNDEKDAMDKMKSKTQDSFNSLSKAIDVQKKALKDSYDSQVASTKEQITSLTAVNKAVAELSTALDSALNTAIEAVGGMSRATAQTLLSDALDNARTTGSLPSADSMKSVFSALSKDATNNFSTLEDFKKDAGITAGKLSALNDITKAQKTTNELQLDALNASLDTLKKTYDAEVAKYDLILSYAQQQLDAMNGTTAAVMSLADALRAFNVNVVSSIAVQNKAGVVGSNGSVISSPAATTDQISSLYQSILGRSPDAAGLAFWQMQASHGATASQLAQAFLSSAEYNGSHANGLDSVPFDGYTAKLHKGEMVLPAKQAKGVVQGSDMDSVVAAVNTLREDNSAENQAMVSDIRYLKKLLQNLSPNGQTLQVTQTVVDA